MSVSELPSTREVRDLLIVDDEAAVCSLLTFALERAYPNRRVRVVRSAEDAIPLLECERMGLLIVDKNLPGLSGFDLVKRLRTQGSRVPVILVTGFFTPETEELAQALQISKCFPKPFFVRDMLAEVAKALEADHG